MKKFHGAGGQEGSAATGRSGLAFLYCSLGGGGVRGTILLSVQPPLPTQFIPI